MTLESLKRFLTPKTKPPAGEVCEFCGVALADAHSHVVGLETRGLLCVCRACYLLFTHDGAAGGKYRAVPDRYVSVRDGILTEAQWDGLQIPVGIAFFFFNSNQGRSVAFYPSPAGATESELSLATWGQVVAANPAVASLVPDVEALLVYKRGSEFDLFIVPIDACYELVGRIRTHWKGFDGGEEAWRAINAFFAVVRERCGSPPEGGQWAS